MTSAFLLFKPPGPWHFVMAALAHVYGREGEAESSWHETLLSPWHLGTDEGWACVEATPRDLRSLAEFGDKALSGKGLCVPWWRWDRGGRRSQVGDEWGERRLER